MAAKRPTTGRITAATIANRKQINAVKILEQLMCYVRVCVCLCMCACVCVCVWAFVRMSLYRKVFATFFALLNFCYARFSPASSIATPPLFAFPFCSPFPILPSPTLLPLLLLHLHLLLNISQQAIFVYFSSACA